MSFHQLSLQHLDSLVREMLLSFSDKQLVLLSGTLGAGKTELVKRFLKALGNNEVQSPTYGLIHEYRCENKKNIYHIDLYRLEGEDDLESSGLWDLFDYQEGLIFIEWADRMSKSQLPLHWDQLHIEIGKSADGEQRTYNIQS